MHRLAVEPQFHLHRLRAGLMGAGLHPHEVLSGGGHSIGERDLPVVGQHPGAAGKARAFAGRRQLVGREAMGGGGQRALEVDRLDPDRPSLQRTGAPVLQDQLVFPAPQVMVDEGQPVLSGRDADPHREDAGRGFRHVDLPGADDRVVEHAGEHHRNLREGLVRGGILALRGGKGQDPDVVVPSGKIGRRRDAVLLQGAERHPAIAAVAVGIEADRHEIGREVDGPALGQLGGDRLVQHVLRRRQVLLQQHRRERKHVADVVETVAGIVGRKVVGRLEIDADQIADRIVVFGAVEPVDGDGARIRVVRVEMEKFVLDPAADGVALGLRRLQIGVIRRHLLGVDPLHHRFPDLGVVVHRPDVLIAVERHVALVLAVAVALVAVLLEERPDVGLEGGRRTGQRGARAGGADGAAEPEEPEGGQDGGKAGERRKGGAGEDRHGIMRITRVR